VIKLVDFSKYKKKVVSEPQTPIETNIPIEVISEPKKLLLVKDIEKEEIELKTPNKDMFLESIEYDIDFSDLANTSDFKRLIYLAITGLTWRGTNKNLELSLKKLKNRLKK